MGKWTSRRSTACWPQPTNGVAGSASHSTYNRALHYAASTPTGITKDCLVLTEHYSFTDEEVSLINYDVKYRTGQEG